MASLGNLEEALVIAPENVAATDSKEFDAQPTGKMLCDLASLGRCDEQFHKGQLIVENLVSKNIPAEIHKPRCLRKNYLDLLQKLD
jgi:hypothetical protein